MLLRKARNKKSIIALMVAWAGLLGCLPTGVSAIPVGSREAIEGTTLVREQDMDRANTLLSNEAVMGKLARMGLSKDDVKGILVACSDAQLHRLALKADKIKAGGSDAGIAIAIILAILLTFIFTLHLTGHKIKVSVEQEPRTGAGEEIVE